MAVFALCAVSFFLFLYLITAAIDSGAGLLYAWALLVRRDERLASNVMSYLSPIWEANTVFLVACFVGIAGYFPQAIPFYAGAMFIPCLVALVFMLARGAFFGYHYLDSRRNPFGTRIAAGLVGIAGIMVPVSLVAFFALADTRLFHMTRDSAQMVLSGLLASPLYWALALLALCSIIYLSGLFLLCFAQKKSDAQMMKRFKNQAHGGGILVFSTSFLLMLSLAVSAPEQFQRLISNDLPFIIIAGGLFIITQIVLWGQSRFGTYAPALWLGIASYAVAFIAYQDMAWPYLIPGVLTVEVALTEPIMAQMLTAVLIGGLVLLMPAFFVLYRLFVVTPVRRSL